MGCRSNVHHLFWPRSLYTGPLERKFRELPCNKVTLDLNTHMLVHAHTDPPDMPLRGEMEAAIQRHKHGDCACQQGRLQVVQGGLA